MPSLIWFQCGACGGDSMSLLNAGPPLLDDFLRHRNIELLYHPSLSVRSPKQLRSLIEEYEQQGTEVDFLMIEGSLMVGPNNSGGYDTMGHEPKVDWVRRLAALSRHVIAVGTCSTYGGVPAGTPNPTDCTGLQWLRYDGNGGIFPADWRARGGHPVINIPGCPIHPATLVDCVDLLLSGAPVEFDQYNRPALLFNQVVHQGCSRNEYHEYGAEDKDFGDKGCLFFNLGCQGPRTHASCNIVLWNGVSSKTRAGVPCLGCTEPHFPHDQSLFKTEKIGPVPIRLPLGVKRANYMAYKGLAHSAAPERIEKREMEP